MMMIQRLIDVLDGKSSRYFSVPRTDGQQKDMSKRRSCTCIQNGTTSHLGKRVFYNRHGWVCSKCYHSWEPRTTQTIELPMPVKIEENQDRLGHCGKRVFYSRHGWVCSKCYRLWDSQPCSVGDPIKPDQTDEDTQSRKHTGKRTYYHRHGWVCSHCHKPWETQMCSRS